MYENELSKLIICFKFYVFFTDQKYFIPPKTWDVSLIAFDNICLFLIVKMSNKMK